METIELMSEGVQALSFLLFLLLLLFSSIYKDKGYDKTIQEPRNWICLLFRGACKKVNIDFIMAYLIYR